VSIICIVSIFLIPSNLFVTPFYSSLKPTENIKYPVVTLYPHVVMQDMSYRKHLQPPFEKGDPRTIENARKGGLKASENRKKKLAQINTFKEMFSVMLDEEDEQGYTLRNHLSQAMLKKAQSGNVEAFKVVRDTSGEQPTASLEVKDITEVYTHLTEEEIKRILDMGKVLE